MMNEPETDESFELWDLRVEAIVPPGAKVYCGARAGDYFELKGEMLDPAAGTGRLDLFARGGPAAFGRQAASDSSERLDDDGRGNRLPRPELPEQAAYCENRAHGVSAIARPPPCRCRRGGLNDRCRRNLRTCPRILDFACHPRRLAARRRPRRDRSGARPSTISSPLSTPASSPSTAPTSTPASRSSIGAMRARLIATRGAEAANRLRVHTKLVPDLSILPTIERRDVEAIIDRSLRRLEDGAARSRAVPLVGLR